MKLDRALAAAALLLASGASHAYQIIEGRYRVETSPGVFQDLLVVRCDDGRTLTVPWETKLAEACNEGLMGERLPKAAAKPQAPVVTAAAPPIQETAIPVPVVAPSTQSATAPALLMDEQAQKEAMLAQVRMQFGNLPEQYIDFKPGADGLSMRFLPPLSDIIKKYEACRRARDLSADCGGERDRALAKLTNNVAPPAAAAGGTPRADKAQVAHKAQPAAGESPRGSAAAAAPATLPEAAQPAVQAPAPAMPDRAATEQKIGEDFASCMRAKPKFECEQARAKALGEFDRPKNGKTKRPAKQAASVSGKVATAP